VMRPLINQRSGEILTSILQNVLPKHWNPRTVL
jgi:hypothetical protein